MLFMGLALVQISRSDPKHSEDVAAKVTKVKVSQLESVQISDEWALPVQFTADSETKIQSDIDGFVTRIYASLGQKVRKGQALMAIQSSDPVRTYRPFIINSPISGHITLLPIKLGQRIQAGGMTGIVANLEVIRLVAEAPESIRRELSPGLRGYLENDQKAEVEIIHVGQSLDPDLGTVRVELKLKSPSVAFPLTAGQIGRVVLKINPRESLVVPRSALIEKGSGSYLVTIDDQLIAHHAPIKVTREFDGKAEIDAPELKGKRIMVQTSVYVNDGETVQVQESQEGEEDS